MDLRANIHLKRGDVVGLKKVLNACERTDNRTVESRCDVVELKARQGGATQADPSPAGGVQAVTTGQQTEQGSEKSQSLFGNLLKSLTQ